MGRDRVCAGILGMAYDTTILADSPIRYWKLRETTGIVATDATAAFNGTYGPNAAGAWTGGTLNQAGPMAFGAPVFNGTNGYVSTGDVPIDGLAHASFEFFIKITGAGKAYEGIYSKFDSSTNRVAILTGDSAGIGYMLGLIVAINSPYAYIGNVFTSGGWYHVVVVYDGTLAAADRVKIYVNGVATGVSMSSPLDPTFPAIAAVDSYIGGNVAGTTFLQDYLAEFAIYNVSLTAAQAAAHYAASAAPVTFTAVVPSTGAKVDLTLSSGVGGINSSEFQVTANGVVMDLGTATGAGAAWSLPLTTKSGWIPAGQTVKVSYFASGLTVLNGSVTATNNSIYTQAQQRYVQRGFGIFVHLSASTWGVATPGDIYAIDMPGYDMEQWFTSVIVPSGARYAVLTAKHDVGFCLWPTDTGTYNIAQTAFNTAHPGADLVRDWVRLCRKYNMGVGLYINFYDPWWTGGHGGVYTDPAYITYMNQQITELFSNYGKIDLLWIDSLAYTVTYANYPWSNVVGLRDSLQPGCLLLNNDHIGTLANSDIGVFEGSGVGGAIPASSNTVPSEFAEDSRAGTPYDPWIWTAANENDYKDVYTLAAKARQALAARTTYLLNFPVNTSGLMPTSTGTYVAALGGILGKQGPNPVVPILSNVRYGIDRGDGQIGAWGGGINSSAILGVV